MSYFKGVVYFVLWFLSIVAGYAALFCPIFPLIFISNRLYRMVADVFTTFWQMYPTALLEIFIGCKISITGHEINADETSLIVMNHRTRTDWNFFWPAFYHTSTGNSRLKHPLKIVLKDEIRHLPFMGWVMQLSGFLFIARDWEEDKERMRKMMDYLCSWKYKFSLLIYPDGTDLTETTKAKSDKYAEQHNLPKYDYVLHPRTTGFAYLAWKLLEKDALDAVYDVTIIYCDNVPQTEMLLLKGKFPKEIKLHFNRYDKSVLPKVEDDLKIFLERRWQEKERNIREFYNSRHFLHGKKVVRTSRLDLYIAFIFWTILPYYVVYSMVHNQIFRDMVFGHTIFLFFTNAFGYGYQHFEIQLYNLKKKLSTKLYFFKQYF